MISVVINKTVTILAKKKNTIYVLINSLIKKTDKKKERKKSLCVRDTISLSLLCGMQDPTHHNNRSLLKLVTHYFKLPYGSSVFERVKIDF